MVEREQAPREPAPMEPSTAASSSPRLEQLGLIGNCQASALVADDGDVVWCCLPRFDSDPVFAALLDPARGGHLRVGDADGRRGAQSYVSNTNVLRTEYVQDQGSFRVTDFMPRFHQHQRSFRPTMLVRILEPLHGTPRVRVDCDPRLGWSGIRPARTEGSHHLEFEGFDGRLRLTTDLPVTYLDGRGFALTGKRHVVLTWGHPVEEPLPALCRHLLEETTSYWQLWVKRCSIPPLYQAAVIRSALALKLHCFEDTGAIVAASTTSIPEAPGSGRTWDYRHCWLRDSYYVLDALRRLGQFEEREAFLHFLLDIAASTPDLDLAPVYRLDGTRRLTEVIVPDWSGYEGSGPVRHGNQASEHRQHDVFGEMALSLAPAFMDDRFQDDQTPEVLKLLARLARKALSVAGTPDAGIWEYRADWRPQTFSSLMCWAAADRMATIAARHAPGDAREFTEAAARLHAQIVEQAWLPSRGTFVESYGGVGLDAALLQMAPLRFLPGDDSRLVGTVDALRTALTHDGWMRRYDFDDGFGKPTVAFIICTFWMVEALAITGREAEARELMDRVLQARSPLGLLGEDFDPATRRLWGNFPQAYSHVGLIHAAFRASPRWADVL